MPIISFISYIPKANYKLNDYSTFTIHMSFNNRLDISYKVYISIAWLVTMDIPIISIQGKQAQAYTRPHLLKLKQAFTTP